MNLIDHQVISRVRTTRQTLVTSVSLLLLTLVVTTVLFITMRSPLKDDIAWLLYVASRWMSGRELYVDLIEVNPPLIVWISAVPLVIADWLDVGSRFIVMPVFVTLALGCAWWSTNILVSDSKKFADRLPVFAVISSALLILPAADLGQREHLLVAAFLPYLVLSARSLERKQIHLAAAILAGVLAGIGCALKPRYAAVFVVLECLAWISGLRPWRVIAVAAGITLLAYAGAVALLCPAYLQHAIPLALALYGATDVPFLHIARDSSLLLTGEVLAISLLWLRRDVLSEYNLMLTLIVFAAISTVICFVDGKDWYYHRLPATVATVLALALWSVEEAAKPRGVVRLPLASACLAILIFCVSSIEQMEPSALEAFEPQATAIDRLEQIIHDEHARTYVAFSEWIALGFPVVNNTGVSWASRFDSMWALKGEVWRAQFDPAADKEWPIARWVAHDFIAGCPEIAVVDTRETTKYISVLSAADPAFARAWSRYRPIASFNGLVIYKRGRGGCLDVWVAAEAHTGVNTR